MFDSGFLEMMVVAVVALLVVGPERLPGIARKVGAFIGKARAFVNTTKADIEKELQAEEMKSMLSRQEQEISNLRDMMQEAQQTIHKEVEELTEATTNPPTEPVDDSSLEQTSVNYTDNSSSTVDSNDNTHTNQK